MYGIGGERDLTERTLDHMSGYRGAKPVRVGNGAWNQHQHDVWGMILDALDYQFRRAADQIVMPVWEGLAGFVDATLDSWLILTRGYGRFVVTRTLHCVQGDVLGGGGPGPELAHRRGDEEQARRWQAGADKIKAEVLDEGVSSRGVFRSLRDRRTRRVASADPVWVSSPPRMTGSGDPAGHRRRADQDDLVLRYRVEGTDTGFDGEEATFTICSSGR